MKTQFKQLLTLGLLVFAMACSKKAQVDPAKGLSAQIQRIVPQSILDTLQKKGMVINQGTTPPKIEGIFLVSPNILVSPYGPKDTYKPGDEFAETKYKFYEQSADNQSVKFDYKYLLTAGSGTGVGSYVSGNGNFFTLFSETTGKQGSLVTYKSIDVISGEITSTGIKNIQTAFIIKSKTGDDSNVAIIAVGLGRILKDGDGVAEKVNSYRIGVSEGTTGGKFKSPVRL